MAIETFNRYENKYTISEDILIKLDTSLTTQMKLDTHSQGQFTYPICNIYYDTADSYLIRTSMAKPAYKEKLRLRSYGTPSGCTTVYAEIKKKYRGLTNKRRSALKLDEAYNFLATGNLPMSQPYMNEQVLREIQYLLSQRKLLPTVYLSYERRVFVDEHSDLRVSFDTNILTRRTDLRLESGAFGESLLPDGTWLLEIKTTQAIPLWLTRLLSEYQIYPNSFSKYGAEYSKELVTTGQSPKKPKAICIPAQPDFTFSPALAKA